MNSNIPSISTFISHKTLELVTTGLLSLLKRSHDPSELPMCLLLADIEFK